MAFLTSRASVQVPATSANLGPGFDSLGLALSLYDIVTGQVGGDAVRVSVSGEGAEELPHDERHLIAKTMLTTFELLGGQPAGFQVICENAIPQARGMGSSSAAIVAGILLARELVEGGATLLDAPAIIRLAAKIEGHPDNVAPCVLGGFTIAWGRDSAWGCGGIQAVAVEEAKNVLPVIFVPLQREYTAHARAVLPTTVPLTDAVFNVARSALLVRALTGTPELLLDATEDCLHQKYRAPAMPDTAKLVATLREKGIAAVISGSGPSVLALVPDEKHRVTEAQSHCPDGWWVRPLSLAQGAHVI